MEKLAMKTMEQTLAEVARPVLSEGGFELVDLELSRRGGRLWVRLFIDRKDRKNGGVTADELGEVNRELGRILDVYEPVPESYTLEVSSPGLDRRVRKTEDFLRFAGREVKITARRPVQGKKNITGKIVAADNEGVEVQTDQGPLKVEHANIARANLVHRFQDDGSRRKKKRKRSPKR